MADNNELQTSRLTNASAGSSIDDALANVEATLRTIFGIPADTAMSEAMSIDSSGNVTMTGTLTLAGDPSTDLMAATKQYVDNNVSASVVRYWCGVATQSVANSSWATLDWASIEDNTDAGSWTVSGSNSGLVPPEEGYYAVHITASTATGSGKVGIKLTGDDTDATDMIVYGLISSNARTASVSRILKLASPDATHNIEASVYQNTGGALNVDLSVSIYRIASAA
jgi:hypothetical protein